MLSLVFLIIFCLSIAGISFIVFRKWSELKAVNVSNEIEAKPLKEKIKELRAIKDFSSEKLLKRFFLGLKSILLKGEKRVDKYLHQVSHSQKFKDDYWKEVKED